MMHLSCHSMPLPTQIIYQRLDVKCNHSAVTYCAHFLTWAVFRLCCCRQLWNTDSAYVPWNIDGFYADYHLISNWTNVHGFFENNNNKIECLQWCDGFNRSAAASIQLHRYQSSITVKACWCAHQFTSRRASKMAIFPRTAILSIIVSMI